MQHSFQLLAWVIPPLGFDIEGAKALLDTLTADEIGLTLDTLCSDEEEYPDFIAAAKEKLDELAKAVGPPGYHDCDVIDVQAPISGERFQMLVTGGMSDGGVPTDSWSSLGFVASLPTRILDVLNRKRVPS